MADGGACNNGFVHDDGKGVVSAAKSLEKVERLSFGVKEKSTSGGNSNAEYDYDPYKHRNVAHPITNNQTLVHLLKTALGTGIFSMPNAFNHSGYGVGIIGTIVLGSIATYCVHLLVTIHYDLCKKKKVPSMSYPLIAEAAFMYGPRPLRKYSSSMIHLINGFLVVYMCGSLGIYVVFVADNFKAVIDHVFEVSIDNRLIMLALALPLIMASWIRNLKYLAPLSTIGNCLTIASFGVICYYIFREPLTLDGKQAVGKLSEFPQFFGTVLFALEAIGVIMPLENEMKRPKDFRGPTGILNRALCVVIALYIGLGLSGYLKYGSNIKPTITLNLPENDLLAQSCKGLIACGILTSHIVVSYITFDMVWSQYILKRIENHPQKWLCEYALRTGIVATTIVLALAIPNLDIFISLVGALTLSTLGIVFPSFLECCTRWNITSGAAKAWMILRSIIICCVGLGGFIIGTSLSIGDIIELYS